MIVKDVIKSPYKLRVYFVGLVMVLVFMIVANYYLLPKAFIYFGSNYEGAIPSFINNLIALLGSSFIASGFIWFVTPSGLNSNDVNVISSHDIKDFLNSMLNRTERFSYYGHTARWNRAVTFPKILEEAKDLRVTKHIDLIIIDPDDASACNLYASFGHGERKKGRKIQSATDVRIELLTTFLCCIEINKSPFIEIGLYVTDKVSISRFDISDNALMLTKPYQGDPALYFPKNTFFYSSYKEEFNVAKQQCKRINLDISEKDIKESNLKKALCEAGFQADYVDSEFGKELLETLGKVEKPY
ncbi:hypothetical protein P3J6_110227 [Pseudoalteromonas sp. 3J6]|uniref:hypothetical protein n=1 Tax=Pseudoalteromonas sp. 3J6 TaxID=649161 RepID=UPI001769FC41|nr:hypothetical protein [Pseudoalteromonas sp. 3J6]CAD2223715.1 hypothetical protein P3J6_110227 [Pseudoalteromonas sp. 3J6]